MKRSLVFASFLALILFISIVSCTKFQGEPNDITISEFGDDESHYNGRNCMDCHAQSGPGEGWFIMAGTVDGNAGNSLIELYRDKSSPYFKVIEVDGEGNFTTTEPIDFGAAGIYVGIRDPQGALKRMEQEDNHPDVGDDGQVYYGSCNTCHGVTIDLIEVD